MSDIGPKSIELIVTEEVSSEATYRQLYTHFEWPGGASGPTVGIGYDCGYCNRNEIDKDWRGRIPDEMVSVLLAACGRTHGAGAYFVANHRREVTIPWEVAIKQFIEAELPKWVARTSAQIPHWEMLPPECKGALVSLAYNRGAGGFSSPDVSGPGRTLEMYRIRQHMAALEFSKIPDEFLSMRRCWPNSSGLRNRRAHESTLFKEGLADPVVPSEGTLPPPEPVQA